MSILEQLQYFDANLRFDLKIPTRCQLEKTAKRIEGLVDTLPSAPAHVPQQLIDAVLNALHRGVPSSLSNKELRVFCIAGLSQVSTISAADSAISELVKEISNRTKLSLYRALLSGYLQIADFGYAWVDAIRRFLKANAEKLPKKWIFRCERYGLLDDTPCKKLSGLFRAESVDFKEELNAAGINGALRVTGIGRKQLYVLCDDLKQTDWLCSSGAEYLIDKFIDFVTQDEKVVYSGTSSQLKIVEALLMPCLSQLPDVHIQKTIERFLLNAYSDPRVNPAKWAHVPEALTALMKRWLTKQAMGLLLEVLNRTADDAHWESRHDFWSFYIDNELVEEAWVVFGPNAFEHAKDLVVTSPDFNAGTFGRIKRGGGQVQQNHSVLLMRIDNVVIAEWTHNGKVRLWERGHFSPAFYRQEYAADELRGVGSKHKAKDEYVHHSRWQEKVDKFIYEHTGIKHGDVLSKAARVNPIIEAKPRVRVSAATQADASSVLLASHTSPKYRNAQLSASAPASGHQPKYRSAPLSASAPVSGHKPKYHSAPVRDGTCKCCGKTKPASEFFMSKRRPGQLTDFCKQCSKEIR